jgi:Protein of unknown function (DUF1203)
MVTMTTLQVLPIGPARLAAMVRSGHDDLGNPITRRPVEGWEPLRCCLRLAGVGDDIALVAYRPFEQRSVWSEVGPVFVHLSGCPGYADGGRLPEQLRTGPRVLRTYHPDGSMDYDDIAVVPHGEDVEEVLLDLLSRPAVGLVHVRSAEAQCFTYEVRAGVEAQELGQR